MFAPGLLAAKRILVTGGGTGLGAAMARRFAELGARLVICGRRAEPLEATAAALRNELDAEIELHRCDLRSADAVEAMMDAIWASAPVDVLVNNAAATFVARSEALSARALDAVLAPTLHGALHCTLATGRRWIEARRGGCVLSILSTSTITGRAFTMPSAVAKSGLLAMTRSLAVEWGPHGIRLVAIAPGAFPTPGATGQLMSGPRAGRDPGERVPLGRVGEHAELANLASYLVSDQAAYVTGEMVTIDGGAHLRGSGAEDLLAWTEADWSALRSARARPDKPRG
ncbi:MAG: SDR family oxidoreductase [Burkholderiaceae bacterium]|nr:SDR family oxidoreductase [Burkholderiaceae bacterium]